MTYFSGRVHSIHFEDPNRAFYILRLVLDTDPTPMGVVSESTDDFFNNVGDSGSPVAVQGNISGLTISIGTWFGFEGEWTNHPKYGMQIRILRAPVIQKDWDADTCEKVLLSKGVGPTIVTKLRTAFGDDLPTHLSDVNKIAEVPGMTQFTALHVVSSWNSARAQFLTLGYLSDLGLPQGKIRQVYKTFGDTSQEVLSVNPWALIQIEGITFHEADAVAHRLHLDTSGTNMARLRGAVLHACRSGRGFGHMFSFSRDILGVVQAIDHTFQEADVGRAIKELFQEKLLVVDRSVQDGSIAIYDPWSHKIEQESAVLLAKRTLTARMTPEVERGFARSLIGEGETASSLSEAVDISLDRLRNSGSISLSKDQAQGVRNALCEPVSVISGLPGTGKTTSLRVAVNLLQEAGIQFLLVAPTGIAAKRVTSLTGAPASTIHRAFGSKGSTETRRDSNYVGVVGESGDSLGVDGSQEIWGFSPESPHPAEVIIVDESSMVDQHLTYRILLSTRQDARLVFVGDAAQLPSVGPGNVLRDLIASGLFPTVSLTEIFRQSDTSPIVHAAHAIHRGDVPLAPVGSDFSLLEVSDDDVVADIIVSAAKKLFLSRKNFQVLSPRHAGPIGVTTLNARLRELINPKQDSLREMKVGSEIIREEDRIMVVRNDYKLDIFNGDVGKVVTIDRKRKEVEIKVHGPPAMHVTIPLDKVSELLRLAYAVTVHKSQGQEYDIIVLPVSLSFSHQLQRNLFYTAVTRARKKVLLVGTRSAMVRAVANERESARNTLFRERLLRSFEELEKPAAA